MKLNKLDGVNLDSFNKRGLHSDGGNLYLQITTDTAQDMKIVLGISFLDQIIQKPIQNFMGEYDGNISIS